MEGNSIAMKKDFESGRSMVEMLGTLAIIGVLSIGGIAGYSYGMDKYRANQTINDVMLMGVDIITQLSQNRGTPTLSADWGTKTTAGYDFEVVQNSNDNTQYGIQITGIPSSVCKIIGDALKQTVDVYVGNEDYDSDTKEDPCDESDKNTMEFYFETSSENISCQLPCETGKICRWGECVNEGIEVTPKIDELHSNCGECAIGSSGNCIAVPDRNGESCSLSDGITGQCSRGICTPKGCSDQNPCTGKNEYCASPNTYTSSNCNAFYENEEGTCTKADFKPFTIDGKEYWISNTVLSWWDADAACKAMGFKGLISIDKLVTGWNNGKTGTFSATPLASSLFTQVSIPYSSTWTSDYPDSCKAYHVSISNNKAYISTYPRTFNDADKYAICQ